MKNFNPGFSRNPVVFTVIFLLFLCCHYATAVGQEKNDYLINPEGDTIVIEAITLLDINTRLEDLSSRLGKFPEVIKKKKEISELDSLLVVAKPLLDKEEERTMKEESGLTIRQIDDSKKQWNSYDQELSKWQVVLTNRISELERNAFETKRITLTWQKTEVMAKEEKAMKSSMERIKDVIQRSKNIGKEIKTRQDSVILLQNQITDFKIRVSEVISSLSQKRIDLQSEYFVKDSPFLWESVDSTVSKKQLKVQLKESYKQNVRQIDSFVDSHAKQTRIHLIIFILLLIIFYTLKRVYKSPQLEEKKLLVSNTEIVLKYFYASAFLLAIVSSFFLYTNFPTAVREFAQVLTLIPAIVLIPKLINKKLHPLLYQLLFLFLIDEVLNLFIPRNFFLRLFLLLEAIYLLWLFIRYTRKNSTLLTEINASFKKVILNFSPIYILLLVVAILSNIIGYLNLSTIIANTVLNSLVIAIIAILVVIVFDSLFFALFSTKFFKHSNIIKNHEQNILKRLHQIFKYTALFIWIRSVLVTLGLYDQTINWLLGIFNYDWEIGSVVIKVGGIFAFFITIVITVILTNIIKTLLAEEVFPRVKLARGVPGAISMVVGYTIVAFGVYVALSAAGIDLGKFGLIASALGVGIGFGLQGVVYNFIAGLILAFERPIQKGDTIEVGTLLGDVVDIGVRASTIRTYDGSEVIIPNGNLISNDLINWTLSDRKRRRVVPVGVAYGSKPREVMELLYNVASEHPEVLDFPKPWPLFDGFGDSSLNFRILFWVDFDRGLSVQSEVAVNIYDALEKAGITVPFPQQDLHVKSFDPTIQKTIFPQDLIKKGRKKSTDEGTKELPE